MPTYLFAWNPKLWNWPELARMKRRVAQRGFVDVEWSSGRTREMEPGSRAFLVRLGVAPKGIVGSGVTITRPVAAPHWIDAKAAAGATTNYVNLRMETLIEPPPVTLEDLSRPPFSRYRWAVRQSGTYVPEPLADALEALWESRVWPAPGKRAGAGARYADGPRSLRRTT
jgi:5-methylcytosine-specific restriction protein A